MSSQLDVFKSIDDALCVYYERLKYSNYRNADGNGIFLQYIIDEELLDDDIPIENELGDGCDPSDCAYSWINDDTHFPIPPYVVIHDAQKERFIFYVLQYCYKNSNPPSDSYLIKRILPQIQGDMTPIFCSEPKEYDRWDDVIYNLTASNNGILEKDHEQIIDHCVINKWSVHDNDINDKIDAIIKSFAATPHQKAKLYESFTDCILSVRQMIQSNEINCSGYDKRYKICAEIIENIQRIGALNDDLTDDDEQLKRLCVSFNFDDILLISDLISKIMCKCINYHRYEVIDNKCFEQIFNHFVRSEFQHYVHDKLEFNQYFNAMRVIMQKRYLSAAKYAAMIKRIKTTDEKAEDDDDDDDDAADAKIDLDLRATQICILSFIVTYIQYLLNHPFNINCTTALNIESSPIGSFKTDQDIHFDIEMARGIGLFNNIFEDQQRISVLNDNLKKHNIAYWTVNTSNQESKENDDINLEFIGTEVKDIGISLDEKQYKENYEDNRLFHIIRAKKILRNKVGVSIHKFVDKKHQFTIKMYWHYNECVIPFTLKDICCSEWYQSPFNSSKTRLTENVWNDVVRPYLKDIWMNYKFEHKSNNLLNNIQSWSDFIDKELEIKCDGFIKRLSCHSDLFKIINDERDYNENTKCTDIVRYKSKYPNMRYPNMTISDTFLIGLWCDVSRQFPKESYLRAHIYVMVSSQVDTEEMIVFCHDKQEKIMFALDLYDKYESDSLYGIMERDYDDKTKWILDEYKTSKEILTYYAGLNKLPQLVTTEYLKIITIK